MDRPDEKRGFRPPAIRGCDPVRRSPLRGQGAVSPLGSLLNFFFVFLNFFPRKKMLVSSIFVENGPNLKKIEGFTVRKEKKGSKIQVKCQICVLKKGVTGHENKNIY